VNFVKEYWNNVFSEFLAGLQVWNNIVICCIAPDEWQCQKARRFCNENIRL
jgi:hypothetical protein